MFLNRAENMYVIMLTNTTRFANMKRNFQGSDFNDTMKMREELHNAIFDDLKELGFWRLNFFARVIDISDAVW